jgi:hypothetical protein
MESVDKIKKLIDAVEKDIADMTDKTKSEEELLEVNIKLRTRYTLGLMKSIPHDEAIELLLEIGSAVYTAAMPGTSEALGVKLIHGAVRKFEAVLRDHCEKVLEDALK